MHDVIVVGGGFAGITAAREAAQRGRSVLLLEARDRLGGRTWRAPWDGHEIEYGGQWVHWHQPHTFSEITRAGLGVVLGPDTDRAAWYVDGRRCQADIEERDAIAQRGWDRFVEGVDDALPLPHDPLFAIDRLARFDRLSVAERIEELDLSEEEEAVLAAEVESLASAPLTEAGAVSVLRWHALSGYSLTLTQMTGGRVTIDGGTSALLNAIASGAHYERRLESPVAEVKRTGDGVEVVTRDGSGYRGRAVVLAVPVNTLDQIEFSPTLPEDKQAGIALGQASRGVKLFIHAQGEPVLTNSVRAGHPFGYLASDELYPDGSQQLIGFGPDAAGSRLEDAEWVQRNLDQLLPEYKVLEATGHDWLADEFARGTWAIHRPGWYEHHHAAMRRPEGRLLLAGSDLANGWAGFIDGAIESGLRAGGWAAAAV
ncbi:MAG TPA: NAD(P)/FAD-dependent oxidoreductase [Solirubrobacteraceae bacterium]|jgi:monoamine oxidase|nr:NAD(P)/FAD-dependent oxidoreductase [Solirubrobacteraceae bacterium]